MSHRFLAFLVLLAGTTAARAQCVQTAHPATAGTVLPDIAGGLVYAAATYDPDGAGPLTPRIIIGGSFTSAGGQLCNHIAQWDGTMWSPMGTGASGDVYALAVHNGELIAGGNFGTAGGVVANCIARWNGSIWRSMTSGGVSGVDGPVLALAEVQGTLYAGGSFTRAGSQTANRLARWQSSWSQAGSGVNGTVTALVADGSRVIVGGDFTSSGGQTLTHVAAFDGNFWSSLGAGVGGSVNALAMFNNQVYVGGSFASANGGATNVWGIARYNGTFWEAVGPNGTGIASTHLAPRIDSMHVYNNRLYIGGLFDIAGGVPCANIASFDGAGFQPLASGVGPTSGDVFAMTTYQGALMATGAFNFAGGTASAPVARWNGTQWSQLSSQPSGPVTCLTEVNGFLVAGGQFDFLTSASTVAHNAVSYSVTGQIGALQNSTGFTGTNGPVRAACSQSISIAVPANTILAGSFTTANGLGVSNIVRLSQFNEPTAMGAGLNDTVRGVLIYASTPYAFGDFTASGPTPASRIARFVSNAWQPLDSGIEGGTPLTGAVYNGNLYVGGDFATAGGLETGGLARWNGSAWSQVVGPFAGAVRATTVYQNKLILAGTFEGVAGSANIMTFDGVSFGPLGTGLGVAGNGDVTAVAVHNGTLYAAGLFSLPESSTLVHLARWNGQSWEAVSSEFTGGFIRAIRSYNGELWVGGSFTDISGRFMPSIARLSCDCYANCDGSTGSPLLTSNDFQCFLNQFAAGSAYANCDGSSGTPALTSNDFQCFLNRFAAGCQ